MAQGPVRITDEVFQVGGPQLTAPQDAAIYLIKFDGHAALIDAGCGRANEALLHNIEAASVKPEDIGLLLITHCHFDHTGGAKWLRDRLGCTIVMHELDALYLEVGDPEVTAASWYGSGWNRASSTASSLAARRRSGWVIASSMPCTSPATRRDRSPMSRPPIA